MGRGSSGSGGGGGARAGGGGGSGGQAVTPSSLGVQQVVTAQQAQAINNGAFPDTDSADFHDLYNGREYYKKQALGIDTRMAVADYLNDQATAGSMYSPSQQLNYKMRQGLPLTANEQFMKDSLMDGMHNLGYNVNLTRYDRVDSLAKFGLGGGKYQNYSEAQLKKMLVGSTFHDDAFTSTSYNNFKNAPSGNVFTDKAVVFKYRAKASVQALMPGIGPGGDLGEMILAPGQKMRIADVKFSTNSSGRRIQGRSGARSYDRIEIYVDVG